MTKLITPTTQQERILSLDVLRGFAVLGILIIKSKGWAKFKRWLSPVGKFALSNYLFTTIIVTLIFYGHGLGLYSTVERIGQLGITLGVWIFLIAWSNYWVKYYRFGPFEWLWRSLTYWKIQPIKRKD